MNNVLERAIKTFVEAFIPALALLLSSADLSDIETLPRVLGALAISAAATGISAVWNGVIDPLLKKQQTNKVYDEEFGSENSSDDQDENG